MVTVYVKGVNPVARASITTREIGGEMYTMEQHFHKDSEFVDWLNRMKEINWFSRTYQNTDLWYVAYYDDGGKFKEIVPLKPML